MADFVAMISIIGILLIALAIRRRYKFHVEQRQKRSFQILEWRTDLENMPNQGLVLIQLRWDCVYVLVDLPHRLPMTNWVRYAVLEENPNGDN